MERNEKVENIRVELVDSTDFRFVSRDDVISHLKLHGFRITGMSLDSVNRSAIKNVIKDIPEVRDAVVYFTPDDELHIRIWQRRPIVRIKSGRLDYYLDENNLPIPFSPRFTPKVLIITGQIDVRMAQEKLYDLAVFISQDPFYAALVQEIYVDNRENLEIIPRIGDQRIFFGHADDYEWKFIKLRTFYEKALPSLGWDKYKSIDLRYSDQVVCKKLN
jgi:cell division protein FtsQ